jgi:hypothetical protein
VGGGGCLIRGGLLYLLVDLISGLVEGVIFGGGRRRSYKRGATVFVGGSDIWPGRGSDLWWWEEEEVLL